MKETLGFKTSQSRYSQSFSLPDSVKEKLPEQAWSVFEESFHANCSIHFAESIFQTRSSGKIEKRKKNRRFTVGRNASQWRLFLIERR